MGHLHEVITRQPCRQKQHVHKGILPFFLEYVAVRVGIDRCYRGITRAAADSGRWALGTQSFANSSQITAAHPFCRNLPDGSAKQILTPEVHRKI